VSAVIAMARSTRSLETKFGGEHVTDLRHQALALETACVLALAASRPARAVGAKKLS